jgi:hypothetical protein
MEEIKIYRIVWKTLLAAIVCLALTAFGIMDSTLPRRAFRCH